MGFVTFPSPALLWLITVASLLIIMTPWCTLSDMDDKAFFISCSYLTHTSSSCYQISSKLRIPAFYLVSWVSFHCIACWCKGIAQNADELWSGSTWGAPADATVFLSSAPFSLSFVLFILVEVCSNAKLLLAPPHLTPSLASVMMSVLIYTFPLLDIFA